MKKDLKRVVVTGMGAISPLGNTVEEFWKNIVAGKSGVALITKFDTTNFKTKFAAEVKGFNASTAVVAKLPWIKNFLLVFITLAV